VDPTYKEPPSNPDNDTGRGSGDASASVEQGEASVNSSTRANSKTISNPSADAEKHTSDDTWINPGWLQLAENAKEALRKAAVDAGIPTPVKGGNNTTG